MRRPPIVAVLALLVCVALLEIPISARRAITLVDDAYSPAPVGDNAITLANVQSGDVVAVIGGIANTGGSNVLTISDPDTHTWNGCPAGNVDNTGETGVRLHARYTTATTAITTINLANGAGSANTYGAAVVYRGMGTISCDATDIDEQDTTQIHGGGISVAPTTTNDTLMFGGFAAITDFAVDIPPAGYTEVGTTLVRLWAGYKVVNSTSANVFVTDTTSNENSVSVLMAIKSDVAAAAGGCGRFSLLGVGC
jgi:hypothetical protein